MQLGSIMKWLRKLTPVVLLLVLAYLAGATDLLGPRVQELIGNSFSEWGAKLKPFLANIIVAALVVALANLLWEPLRSGLSKAMERSQARERARNVVLRVLQILYWAVAIFLALSILSPDLVSKFFIGVSMVSAAIAFAMQGFARDLISGLLLEFSPHINEGDDIELVGLAVKGKVVAKSLPTCPV